MSAGKIRRSQLITTFGIGAITDLVECSVMVVGHDSWNLGMLEPIVEERLARKLNVDGFKQPKPDTKLPAVRFPRWVFCKKCNRLAPFASFGINQTRCSCQENCLLIPARFVVVCKNGHIDDFPWIWWVHGDKKCDKPRLLITDDGKTTALSGIIIKCRTCKKSKNLGGIFGENSPIGRLNCLGRRPWLGETATEKNCGEKLLVVQRGSASVWYQESESVINIPPYSQELFRKVGDEEATLKAFEGLPEEMQRQALDRFLKAKNETTYTAKDYLETYKIRKEALESDLETEEPSIRYAEYKAITTRRDTTEKDEFHISSVEVPPRLQHHISQIVLVHRLREVVALTGFHRDNPTNPVAELSFRRMRWLPAMEVKGEGIFIELATEAIREWKIAEGNNLFDNIAGLEKRRNELIRKSLRTLENPVTPEFLLIHTLSHLFIQDLTIECGYSSASLRERLYVDNNPEKTMNGFLIFTATADSDGSLGGLVRQGNKERFEQVFLGAVENARWCSNDPVCIESEGQGTNSLNLAACHSCALLPETSCEQRNSYLDRGVVVGKHNLSGYCSGLTITG